MPLISNVNGGSSFHDSYHMYFRKGESREDDEGWKDTQTSSVGIMKETIKLKSRNCPAFLVKCGGRSA